MIEFTLVSLYQQMSLIEQDEEVITVEEYNLEDAIATGISCLIFKLLTSKHFNKEALKLTMK